MSNSKDLSSIPRRWAIGAALAAVAALTACATKPPPSLLVYSSGFSFANYDFVVVAKPDGNGTSTSLYGLDVEFANLMSRYNMKVVGDRELVKLPPETQRRALFARMSISSSNRAILMSVSFDETTSGKTGASITTLTKGQINNLDARIKAFNSITKSITVAIANDKSLKITEEVETSK